jgi:hypothetical protein
VLSLIELVRQLLEAQVIRRMEEGELSDAQLDRAAEALRRLQQQVLAVCDALGLDPEELNVDLGEVGTLLPREGTYYPGRGGERASVLELLDRLLHTGVVLEGSLDLGLAQLDLIHARLQLVLTSRPLP